MTLTEKVYQALRRDLVRGAFPPGRPLRLAELGERYGTGFTPLREALNRLQAEGLVTAESLRGFRVAPLSLAALEDALQTRLMIESEALKAAIRRGGDDWAAAIVSTLYALRLQAERMQGAAPDEADLWELETRHHAFHRALLSACGSVWMLDFFERLYTATERYRLPALSGAAGPAGRDIHAEHAAIAEATLARDAARAEALLREHYRRTADRLRDRLTATLTETA